MFLDGNAVGNPSQVLYANIVGSTNTVYAFPSTAINAATGTSVFVEIHNPTGTPITAAALTPTTGDFVVTHGTTGGTGTAS